jgi:hypothetical protein
VCAECKSVAYCNNICQLAHWPVHKAVCKAGKAARLAREAKARERGVVGPGGSAPRPRGLVGPIAADRAAYYAERRLEVGPQAGAEEVGPPAGFSPVVEEVD